MATQHPGIAISLAESFGELTPREHEVADLISQGLTNEAIVQRLTLTAGTVANHVAHILAKTGARSQLAVHLVRAQPSRGADDVLALLTRLQALGLTDLQGALQHVTEVLSAFSGADGCDAFVANSAEEILIALASSRTRLPSASVLSACSICPCPTADASPGSSSSSKPSAMDTLKTTRSSCSPSATTWACDPRWPFRSPCRPSGGAYSSSGPLPPSSSARLIWNYSDSLPTGSRLSLSSTPQPTTAPTGPGTPWHSLSSMGTVFPTEPERWSRRSREILATAYELTEAQVAHDATHVQQWLGSDHGLIAALEQRHGWSRDSELGPYFLAALRDALAP
jgi:DNA-binding CsgD family transcriptional regulator